MKTKPIIGVLPLYDDEKESVWMLPGYLDSLQLAGAIPLTLPQELDAESLEQVTALCDGFLFTGGHDINPAMYGEKPIPACGLWNEKRDRLEKELFDAAYEKDIPLLGICRGIQLVNVAMGGTLYQDLPSQHGEQTEHHMTAPYDRVCHMVTLKEGSPLRSLLGCEQLGVNSYHHQAVKQLAPMLREMARSEDGLIEAIYDPARTFLWAVQWHPEFAYASDPKAYAIVTEFVRTCRKKAGITPCEKVTGVV